jgi:hypothetical protein
MVLKCSDLQDPEFLECPTRKLFREFLVSRVYCFPLDFYVRIEPGVVEDFHRSQNCQAGRVASLERRDKAYLFTRGEEIIHHI